MKFLKTHIAFIFCIGILFTACNNSSDTAPRPRAYLRIDLPKKEYRKFDTISYPYTFEYPVYAQIKEFDNKNNYWLNINYPRFGGSVYITYKCAQTPQELSHFIDTSTQFMSIQFQKSSGVSEKEYTNTEQRVFASMYHIKGSGVASSYQFWATDSNSHFLRGALYFNRVPNNDSIAPIIDFIGEDIEHLISTLQWNSKGGK